MPTSLWNSHLSNLQKAKAETQNKSCWFIQWRLSVGNTWVLLDGPSTPTEKKSSFYALDTH